METMNQAKEIEAIAEMVRMQDVADAAISAIDERSRKWNYATVSVANRWTTGEVIETPRGTMQVVRAQSRVHPGAIWHLLTLVTEKGRRVVYLAWAADVHDDAYLTHAVTGKPLMYR